MTRCQKKQIFQKVKLVRAFIASALFLYIKGGINLTKGFSINVDKTGFPVSVGEVEFWFDSSIEGLENFLNADKVVETRLEEVKKKAKGINIPEITEFEVSDIDPKFSKQAIALKKEVVGITYDVLLGEGAFDKIYKTYPDVFELERIINPLQKGISESIQEQEEARLKETKAIESEYLNKKQQKKK